MPVHETNFNTLIPQGGLSYPRVAGSAGMIELIAESGRIVFEEANLSLIPAGFNRIVKTRRSTLPCFGFATAVPQFAPGEHPATWEFTAFRIEGSASLNGVGRVVVWEQEPLAPPTVVLAGGVLTLTLFGPTVITGTPKSEVMAAFEAIPEITNVVDTNPADVSVFPSLEQGDRGPFEDGVEPDSLPQGMEIVNIADLPDEWKAQLNETGSNVRVTTEQNQLLPFDAFGIGGAGTSRTGAIILRRPLLAEPEPVRCWVCDSNMVRFPPGYLYGQYFAYPPWMLSVWPAGRGQNRLQFDWPLESWDAPPPNEDPFSPPPPQDSDSPPACRPVASGDVVVSIMALVPAPKLWSLPGNDDLWDDLANEDGNCLAIAPRIPNPSNEWLWAEAAIQFPMEGCMGNPQNSNGNYFAVVFASTHGLGFPASVGVATHEGINSVEAPTIVDQGMNKFVVDLSPMQGVTITINGETLPPMMGWPSPQPPMSIRKGGLRDPDTGEVESIFGEINPITGQVVPNDVITGEDILNEITGGTEQGFGGLFRVASYSYTVGMTVRRRGDNPDLEEREWEHWLRQYEPVVGGPNEDQGQAANQAYWGEWEMVNETQNFPNVV